MLSNQEVITQFYTAFKNSDASKMIELYDDQIEFSDPVFPNLKGEKAKAMWMMLCQNKVDPSSRWFENVKPTKNGGTAHWEAKYAFPLNGRPVHNKIDSTFEILNGKIIRQIDCFDFWKWAQMAFGPAGYIFGWTPFFQRRIQMKIATRLEEFVSKNQKFL